MLDNQIITIFILACIALVVMALGFFAKNWMATLNATIKELAGNVRELSNVVHELQQEQAVQRIRIRTQMREIRKLQANVCTCSGTSPGTERFIPRTRISDFELGDEGLDG